MIEGVLEGVREPALSKIELRVEGAIAKLNVHPVGTVMLDGEGRWLTARAGSCFLRRKADSGVYRTVDGRSDVAADLPADTPWHEVPRAVLRRGIEALGDPAFAGALRVSGSDRGEAPARLAAAARWDRERYLAESGRFALAYPEAVPILPPDRYRDLPVLPALGCPHARCTFCTWYTPGSFRVLEPDELDAHLARVAGLFGRSLANRTGVFLGSASALSIPDARLLPALERIEERFGRLPRGLGSFLDPDHAPRRQIADWRRLADAGLERAVVGLETGHRPLRRALGKADDLGALGAAVEGMRGAGIGVAITVLAGVGPTTERGLHHTATANFLAGLDLGGGDIVYVSPLVGGPAGAGAREATDELKATLRARLAGSGAKVAPYELERYRFFAW